MLEKFQSRLPSWRGTKLPFGGRIVLISSVLNSLIVHFFSFFKAPKLVINEMIKYQIKCVVISQLVE